MAEITDEWKQVDEVAGLTQGEILKGLLESQGINVLLAEEGAAGPLGLASGPMGTVYIYVHESNYEAAKEILEEYYEGDLYIPDQDETDSAEGEP